MIDGSLISEVATEHRHLDAFGNIGQVGSVGRGGGTADNPGGN